MKKATSLNSKKHKEIAVFFTGGWDSTYMLLSLLTRGYRVKPIYILNNQRKSHKRELSTIEKIVAAIDVKHFPGILDPVFIYPKKQLKRDRQIIRSYKWICKHKFLGTQYVFLAQFAREFHDQYPKIGLGVENSPGGRFRDTLDLFGKLRQGRDFVELDCDHSDPHYADLFENIVYPIIGRTPDDMVNDVKNWHCEDVMKNIWFCHTPLHGEPCGTCPPCRQKMENKMDWLLPASAKKHYASFHRLEQRFGFKLTNFFFKRTHFLR